MINNIKEKSSSYYFAFFVTFFSVIICNGAMIFNKITWHDDSALLWGGKIDIDTCLGNGRWFFWILVSTVGRLFGTESASTVLGLLAAFLLACAVCCIIYVYKIESRIMRLALCIIFASMPQTLCHFGYIVTIGYDDFGALLAIVAVIPLALVSQSELSNSKKIGLSVLSGLFLCLAIGEYQCNLTIFLVMALLLLLLEVSINNYDFKRFFIRGCSFLLVALVALLFYLAIMKISLLISGISLTSYAGISSLGMEGFIEYLKRVYYAYKYFIKEPVSDSMMFPFVNGYLFQRIYLFCFLVSLFLSSIVLITKKSYLQLFEILICVALTPLAFGFNIVMYGFVSQHSLHTFHYGLLYIVPYILTRDLYIQTSYIKLLSFIKDKAYVCVAVLALLLGIRYIWYDSVVYTDTLVNHEQTINYLNRMISRIECAEGFSKDKIIVFVNPREISGIDSNHAFITTNPYQSGSMINSYMWEWQLYYYCGLTNPITTYNHPEYDYMVEEMGIYPDSGSILVVDNYVFVKMR